MRVVQIDITQNNVLWEHRMGFYCVQEKTIFQNGCKNLTFFQRPMKIHALVPCKGTVRPAANRFSFVHSCQAEKK
jgi:hypothetical protein